MNCSKADAVRAYFRGELTEKENRQVEKHVDSCPHCSRLVSEEDEFVLEIVLPPSRLPSDFTQQVMRSLENVPIPIPKPNWKKRSISIMKKTALAVASVTALITFGSIVSPTFASYVTSVIDSIKGVDNGIKKAVETGYVQVINKSDTVQGVTFTVEEVVADPTRIAIFSRLVDRDGKQIKLRESEKFIVTFMDKDGNEIERNGGQSQRPDGEYFVFEREIFKDWPEPSKIPDEIQINIKTNSLDGRLGSWEVTFPVDMKKARTAAVVTDINQQYTTPQGISFSFKNIMTTPSASIFEMERTSTDKWTQRLNQIMSEHNWNMATLEKGKNKEADMVLRYLKNVGIAVQIFDEKGNAVAGYDDVLHADINNLKKNDLKNMNVVEGSEDGSTYTIRHGFSPFAKNQKLTMKLHSLYLHEPANFEMTVDVNALSKHSVAVEKDGTSYLLQSIHVKNTDKEERIEGRFYDEPGVVIPFIGKLPEGVIDSLVWKAKDESGKVYDVSYNRKYNRGEDGRIHVTGAFFIEGMVQQPKTLTLSYMLQKKQYRNLQWEVPFEIEK